MVTAVETRTYHVKGAGVLPLVTWYSSQWGRPRLAELARSLDQDVGGTFDPGDEQLGILSSSWYPASALHALLDAMVAGMTPEQRSSFARDAARAVMESTLRGVYRWLFEAMMSPERYLRYAQRLFRRYYDSGEMTKRPMGPTWHRTVLRNWHSHHPLLCEFLRHSAQYIYSSFGCKEVNVQRLGCVADGDDGCTFDISWTAR